MARAELNSLLDVAARRGRDDDAGEGGDDDANLHGYSEKELREELERRQRARDEVEELLGGRKAGTTTPPRSPDGAGRRPTTPPRAPVGEALQTQKAYAALELPPGSDFEAVRRSYRALMRKYHPDHHTGSPEKQRAANEVAQRLTEAYKLLEKKLRKK